MYFGWKISKGGREVEKSWKTDCPADMNFESSLTTSHIQGSIHPTPTAPPKKTKNALVLRVSANTIGQAKDTREFGWTGAPKTYSSSISSMSAPKSVLCSKSRTCMHFGQHYQGMYGEHTWIFRFCIMFCACYVCAWHRSRTQRAKRASARAQRCFSNKRMQYRSVSEKHNGSSRIDFQIGNCVF